ncbi:MAG TPA: hypothetical protein DCG78_00670 [Anaerolineaceae bacterium]|nr:hypothetical protein [Anaerolineaceae bacterium]
MYNDRINTYKKIEEIRQRPLIVYITSSRQNASGQMASDVIPQFIKQLLMLPNDSKLLDILVVSNGGDPIVSWRIISMLREKFTRISILLPYAAYSAATLLALGCDEIIMHPFSNLGPVDPQLSYQKRNLENPEIHEPEIIQFGSEDLRNYFDFIKTDVGISDQEQLERAFELVCKEVGSIPIGVAKRSSQLALSMGEKLLNMHLGDSNRAKSIAEALNKSFYHHGYPLGLSEAKKIGLPVIKPPSELEGLLWEVWQDLELEMKCNDPFDPSEVILKDKDISTLIGPVPQIQLPVNLPTDLKQQVYNSILQQINIVSIPPIDYDLFQATVESIRCRSEFHTKLKINAVRLPDMNLAVNVLRASSGWSYFGNEIS